MQLQTDVDRHRQQYRRQQERNTPAPFLEVVPGSHAATQDDQQRQKKAQGGRGLNPAGVKTTTAFRRMLRHVGGSTTVFATQRQALQQTQHHQGDRRCHTDGLIARQTAHQKGGAAHDDNGDEEGVLAPHQVAKTPENQGAEGPDEKAGGKGQQGKDEARGLVHAREELLGDERR